MNENDLFRYEWPLRGENASFAVDLSYAEKFASLGDFVTLLYVTCLPVKTGKGAFSRRDEKNLLSIQRDISDLLGEQGVFVGSIDVPGQRWLYYYTSDAKLFLKLSAFCESEGSLNLTCGRLDEPDRRTYFDTLYPDAARLQKVKDLSYIETMKKRGDQLGAARRINLHLSFASLPAMQEFAGKALESDFTIGETGFNADSDHPYELTLHCVGSLTMESLEPLTTSVIHIAEGYEGRLNYMDSAFVRKR